MSGIGSASGINVSYEGWLTTISGTSMSGGFTVHFFVNGGDARYDVNLVNVTRTSTSSSATAAPLGIGNRNETLQVLLRVLLP